MRGFLKSGPRWLQAGWLLPMVLLALPNCALDSSGTIFDEDPPPVLAFDPGPAPQMSAVMCDIPKPPNPRESGCAVGDESDISFASAAVALAEGHSNSLVLDFSPAATGACVGLPKKVEFFGPFPDGVHVCLNCGAQIPTVYADAKAVCVAKCIDLVNQANIETAAGAQSYCQDNATVSTNVNQICFADACTNSLPNMPFNDPRRVQEPVKWTDLEGNAALGSASGGLDNTLTKSGGADMGTFDSSAQSEHLITRGDAWIEFEAAETDVSHVVGVSTDAGIGSDLQVADLAFALSLNYDASNVYVLESGVPVPAGPIGTYVPGQRFRIEIKDNNDQTASISYVRLDGACPVGSPCAKTTLAVSQGTIPYPIRVSAMFREPNATLVNVTMVRIQD